ncbi:hypothetical protein BH24ACT7_BH24ACT7_07570 [soil metagenome]
MDHNPDDAEGLGDLTRRAAEALVRMLVRQGEATADRAEQLVTDALARSERNRDALLGAVRAEIEPAVDRLGLVRREELQRLAVRVETLERRLAAASGPRPPRGQDRAGGPPGTATAARTSAAERRARASRAPAPKPEGHG